MSLSKTVIAEVPGHGFQKRTVILDPSTSKPLCLRIGGIPYARPPQRWQRASPLPSDYYYGSRETASDFTGVAAECPQPGRKPTPQTRESCLELNIWLPADTPPTKKWPVFFYIHGGFLQWGTPNGENPTALLTETPLQAIIVMPSYRLNVFGFMTSAETMSASPQSVSNLGFWDQRLALEWTAANISLYGGDPTNITVGGLSAGAYSTFHQLAYEALRVPPEKALIRRVVMWSNGCGVPPKLVHETRYHFDAMLRFLGIPLDLPAEVKLQKLRSVSAERLVKAVEALPENAFRVVTDFTPGSFVDPSLFAALRSGRLAAELDKRGIRLLLGEVRDEFNSYRLNSPPKSYAGLVDRLAVEYPIVAAERMARVYCGREGLLPAGYASWQDLFGRVYADMQVHVSQRGLIQSLAMGMSEGSISRYRIAWRPQCVDAIAKRKMGVMHGSDMSIWWFGNAWGKGLKESEKPVVRQMVDPLARFLKGEDISHEWGTRGVEMTRTLVDDGRRVEIRNDERWQEAREIFSAVLGEDRAKL